MTSAETIPHARNLPDRRCRKTPLLSRYWLRGRRSGGRRDGETSRIYVDRYSTAETALFLVLVTLSITDLVLTLIHLEAGGAEANPLMAWFLIHGGTSAFVTAKLALTMVGGLVLLIHVRFPGVRRALQTLVGVYSVLMVYHAYVAVDRAAILA